MDHAIQEPRITHLPPTRLIGMAVTHSLAQPQTPALWRGFMPRRREIEAPLSGNLYSVEQYTDFDPVEFRPTTEFVQWAAVPVADDAPIPPGMRELRIEGGLYAVFRHRGPASDFPHTAQFIFSEWLPRSGHQLEGRCHFEIMAPDYLGPQHPEAEEDVWIPIR